VLASVPGIPLGVYFLKIVNVLFFRIGMMQINQEVATDRSTAEFAVIVADPWQGKGLCWA
jgi:ABC-type sugar transport system permease subunit